MHEFNRNLPRVVTQYVSVLWVLKGGGCAGMCSRCTACGEKLNPQ